MKITLCLSFLFLVSCTPCLGKRSSSSKISPSSDPNINVKVCQVGWKEVHERIEYTPGSGQRVLFPDAELQLCDVPCETKNVSLRLTLATNHIGKGCDRDTYSVESQRKLCGASAESVDLLPSPGIGSEWTRDLPTDEGRESDQIYEFDGNTNAVVVPETTLNHNLTKRFTISFWMKHESTPDHGANKHIKEHILCNADDHKKNRHHYSLFVRNCRLILLLRQEYNEEKHTVFRPAEWRWKLAETCDNEWHHYAVSVDFPEVTLFLDGQKFRESQSNPEVVDDWPLHSVHGVNTTLVVGACWEGRDNKMNFHLRGFLAGLSVLRGRTENPDVLSCLHRCKEGLQLPASDTMDPGTDVTINSDATTITIEGRDSIDVEDMLSQISYINSREFPTPGRRSLRLTTSVKCSNGKPAKIPSLVSYIIVLPPEQPSITLNGTSNLAREYESFVQGIELFTGVSVSVNHEPEQDPQDPDLTEDNVIDGDGDSSDEEDMTPKGRRDAPAPTGPEHKLDACTVRVYPPLNPDHEYFRLPVNFMEKLGVHYKETKDGIVIHGADTVHNYQSILREIVYFNRKPAYYLNRAFKLSCSELNGRFTSNDYIQTLTVIHPKDKVVATPTPSDVHSSSSQDKRSSHTRTLGSPSVASSSSPSHESPKTSLHPPPQQQIPTPHGHHVVHQDTPVPARAQVHDHRVELKESRIHASSGFLDSGLMDAGDAFSRPGSINTRLSPIVVGHAVTVIIVVCVGFLVFMVVLGVIRIRAAHHRTADSRDDEQEMSWDDTALTITVNPLDAIGQEPDVIHMNDDDDDSESSGSSYHEDGESSEEEEPEGKGKDMAWDDSALNF